MRYTVFQVPDPLPPGISTDSLRWGEGTAAEVVAKLLPELTLDELHALKLHGLLAAQKVVAKKAAEAAAVRVAAEYGTALLLPPVPTEETYDLDDRFDQVEPVVPPGAISAAADEDDEPLEPTPLEVIGPDAGVRDANG